MRIQLESDRSEKLPFAAIGAGLSGAAAGAALFYWLDPSQGARRRAVFRQKTSRAVRGAASASRVTARDLALRSKGLWARSCARIANAQARLRGIGEEDAVIAERVRARLGRLCSRPGAIEVSCHDGHVILKGPVLRSEANRVVRGIAKVHGVRAVEDALERHETPGNVPSLQGAEGRRFERPEVLQEHWSPTARLILGATGASLAAWGFRHQGALGAGGAVLGLGLLARSLTNMPMKRLTGLGAGRRAVDVRKQIHVQAPPEQVYAFFNQLESFPRFMSHVRKVEPQGDNRWRWSVDGPAGLPVSWDAEVTKMVPNRLIAWRSVKGSGIRNAGHVRFQRDRGGTRVDIRLTYNPPAGAVGHAVASLFRADPRRQLDDDMLRLKNLVEAR